VVYALYALKTGGHAHRHEKFGHMHDYALEKQEHIHEHDHHEKNEHEHAHFEDDEHKHGHAKESKASYGFAAIIGLTPCVLMLPFFWQASQLNDWASALVVTVTFIACTLITMICMAILGLKGTMLIKSKKFEKNANILAGIIIAAVGLTIYVTETIVGV
jgi:ABC-type nickel/cobalt efflux system permease component RcnA